MTSIGARVVVAASNVARKLGQSLDRMGASVEVCKHSDRLVPSTRFVAVNGVGPTVSESAVFVAPSASVIGDVTLGSGSSVWYGATVRGDVNRVVIGDNTSVGDRAVVHVAKIQGDFSTNIGSNVSIGPGAIIHAATLMDSCVVGPSAQVLDGAVVESSAVVAPGAIVTPGTKVEGGQLWAGAPAKFVRKVTADELQAAAKNAEEVTELARLHAGECAKDLERLTKDEEEYEDKNMRDPNYWQPQEGPELSDVLGQGSPGLIFDSVLTKPEEGLKFNLKKKAAQAEKGSLKK